MLLLPVVAFGLLWLLISAHRRTIGFAQLSRRGTMVLAFLAFELIVLGITEVSSIGSHLTSGTVVVAWAVVIVVLAVAARSPVMRLVRTQGALRRICRHVTATVRRTGIDDRIWLVTLAVFFGIMVALGMMYLPSNVDSLVYHLTRVEHWIQNRTIAPFATHYPPQVEFVPLSEYNLALLHLLSGTDRFDAAVDLLATLICVVGSSELARLLGANRSVQIMAAVLCVTIPTGILLATSTENDPMAAAMAIGLLVVGVSLSIDRRWPWQAAVFGVTVGLAYMTKSTLIFLMGPAVIAFLALAVYRFARLTEPRGVLVRCSRFGALAVVCALAVIGPFTGQIYELFNSPFGQTTTNSKSTDLTLDAGAANVIRTTANNFQIGNGKSGFNTEAARVTLGGLKAVYGLFHISQSDPRYTVNSAYRSFVVINYDNLNRTEGGGANPWTVVVLTFSFFVLVVAAIRGTASLRTAAVVAVALAAGYVLFAFVDKWGPFDARYGLPLLDGWCALMAIALSRFRRWVSLVIVGVLVLTCLPQLVNSQSRPLQKPASYGASYLEPYFIGCCQHPEAMALAYETITANLAQSTCTHAAIANLILYEYPLWPGLDHNGWKGTLDDTDLPSYNPTKSLEPKEPPCATITQQGPGYRTPDNGTVNLQLSDLALSVDAERAMTMHTPIPSFISSIPGVRVWPGGGWLLTLFEKLPVLDGNGSIYIASRRAGSVQLQLRLPSTLTQPTPSVIGPNGKVAPSTVSDHIVRADLRVNAGMNRVALQLSLHGVARPSVLLQVAVAAAVT